MDRVKRIWYLSPMRAAKVQASLRIRAVSPEPSLLAHTSSESRGTFRQKTRSLAPLNGWACAVKICHDGMLEDTNSLDRAHVAGILRPLLKHCRWLATSYLYQFFFWFCQLQEKQDSNCPEHDSLVYEGFQSFLSLSLHILVSSNGWFGALRPFQQYFSHIRRMDGWKGSMH